MSEAEVTVWFFIKGSFLMVGLLFVMLGVDNSEEEDLRDNTD